VGFERLEVVLLIIDSVFLVTHLDGLALTRVIPALDSLPWTPATYRLASSVRCVAVYCSVLQRGVVVVRCDASAAVCCSDIRTLHSLPWGSVAYQISHTNETWYI